MRSNSATTLMVMALLSAVTAAPLRAQEAPPPVYVWLEPEWFEGVESAWAYWLGFDATPPKGHWAIAGPGISAEWTQGGESGWNSIGAPAAESRAECRRELVVPRAGNYRLWVRYVDHRKQSEPFTVRLEQEGRPAMERELGAEQTVPVNDEYQLYWNFSFGWDFVEGELAQGPAALRLLIDKPGEAWRQVDAVLLTNDLSYVPVQREKPPFAYFDSFALRPEDGAAWRGSEQGLQIGRTWQRKPLGGRDFSMWTQIDFRWPEEMAARVGSVTLYDLFFAFSPEKEIREAFHQQFAGRRDVPLISWPDMLPTLWFMDGPDLSPGQPIREWLERTKTPFAITTNWGNPVYDENTGPAMYEALTGPLADQFMGYIHGEVIGSFNVVWPINEKREAIQIGDTRREHLDAVGRHFSPSRPRTGAGSTRCPSPRTTGGKASPA